MKHVIELRLIYEQIDGVAVGPPYLADNPKSDRARIVAHLVEAIPSIVPDEAGDEAASLRELTVLAGHLAVEGDSNDG